MQQEYRPWGSFASLAAGDGYHLKTITVLPGKRLSLQSHRQRSEHWIVIAGTAQVTIDKTILTVGANQSVFIPRGAVHRLKNAGAAPLLLIEVQTGDYFGEDDIERFEDDYGRI